MAYYDYKCKNKECSKYDEVITLEHSINEVGTKICECGQKLIRDYRKVGVGLCFSGSYNSTK